MEETSGKPEITITNPEPAPITPVVAPIVAPVVDGKNRGKAVASLVLGIIGLLAWLVPLFGFPINITGLVLGLIAIKSSRRGFAIAGVIMCGIGIILSIISAIIGVLAVMSMMGE